MRLPAWPRRVRTSLAMRNGRGSTKERTYAHEPRAGLRSRPSRPYGIADAEAGREPEILCRRHGHDGQRPTGRVGLLARLGRLRALFAEANGVEDVGHGPY